MSTHRHKIVGLGEVLWDMLPSGRQLGGAPANFAYISTLLGNEGVVASRVGSDPLGAEAASRLATLGVTTDFLQKDAVHPTGVVQVEVDNAGQPKFEIAAGVAWDFLEWTPDWQNLAGQADAICFGSLAQRRLRAARTIRRFIKTTRSEAVRVFDVNLRQAFFSRAVLEESMELAEIVKLNDHELPRVMQLFGLEHRNEVASAVRACRAISVETGVRDAGRGG